MVSRYDDAVVGAGIIGLAHAYHLARRGRSVIVFERGARATGASIRNFGMLWPIGQPAGPTYRVALRSLELWRVVLAAAGFWHAASGSLHLAYREDEEQVLREFANGAREPDVVCELLGPKEVLERSPAVNPNGLRAGLSSPTEIGVDSREVVAGLPAFLHDTLGVTFAFNHAVTSFDAPRIRAGGSDWSADRLWVCAGDDFQSLFPEAFRTSGLSRCKLQMMRSEPTDTDCRLGPMLAAGLTLRHYRAFERCPSQPALRARVAAENPEFDRYGIHVMAAQNGRSEIVIGDSHEYDDRIEPFDKACIDRLILDYLATFLAVPNLRIAQRWHGTYARHPSEPYLVAHPSAGVTAVTVTGGLGMTLSFGLAERIVDNVLGG